MFLRINKSTDLDRYLDRYFSTYKSKIYVLLNSIYKDENIWGRSDKQYILNQFFFAFTLIALLYTEFKRGLQTSWDYYITKYCLVSIKKKLACNGLNLDDILLIFDLPSVNVAQYGIGRVVVEGTLIVEDIVEVDDEDNIELFDIHLPLSLNTECYLAIEDVCKCISLNKQLLVDDNDDNMLLGNDEYLEINNEHTILTCQNNCY